MKKTLRTLAILSFVAFACTCTPEQVHVERVTLDATSVTLLEQETCRLTATVSPSSAANALVLWSSDNKSVATVSSDGLVTAVASGKAIITATSDDFGRTAECTVTVVPRNATSITVDPSELTLHELEQYILKLNLVPENADASGIMWASSNTEVASVSSGVVHALKAGSATITASSKDGDVKGECALTVICDVKGVKFEDHSFTLTQDETLKLAPLAHVYPERATNKELTWSSSDSNVATVSQEGEVKALAYGSTVITVTTKDGGFTDTCTIDVDMGAMTLNETALNLVVEETFDLVAKTATEGVTISDVNWTITDGKIASVDKNGHVIALSAGDAIICATSLKGGHHAFCSVNVRNKVESITMSKKEIELYIGSNSYNLSVALVPEEAAEYVKIVWKSSDENVASVDQSGRVTPVGKGNATIIASTTDGKVSDNCKVTVRQPVTSIKVTPASSVLWLGDEKSSLTVEIGPEEADDKSFNVKFARTSADDVVKFTPDGTIIWLEALKVGTAKLEVIPSLRLGYEYATCDVEVRAHVKSVSIKGGNDPVSVGKTCQLEAVIDPSDAYDKKVTWKSSETSVATVDSKGLVTAIKPGSTVITVTTDDGKKTASCTIKVSQPVNSVTVTPSSLTLTEGETGSLSAVVKPSDASQNVKWETSDGSVATVNSNGKVTAVGPGDAIITAISSEDSSIKDYCNVTVKAKVIHVSSVDLQPKTLELYKDDQYTRFEVTVLPQNTSQGVDRGLEWDTSNKSVVTVDAVGNLTAVGVGTATITCTSKDNKDAHSECVVTVSLPPVPVESIELSRTSVTLEYGTTTWLTATVKPDDATNKEVTWSSNNTSVATVDSQSGMITAKQKKGTAVITAKSADNPSVTAQCTVTVVDKVVPIKGLTISPLNMSLYVGQTKKITATITPADATDQTLEFNPAPGARVVVDQQGNVTGKNVGDTKVTVYAGVNHDYQVTCRITVTSNRVSSIDVSHPNGIKLTVGEEYDLTATIIGYDSTAAASYPSVKWTSNSTSLVTVTNSGTYTTGGTSSRVTVTNSGHVKALKPGTAIITVTSNESSGIYAECPVTVVDGSTGSQGSEGVGFDDWNF